MIRRLLKALELRIVQWADSRAAELRKATGRGDSERGQSSIDKLRAWNLSAAQAIRDEWHASQGPGAIAYLGPDERVPDLIEITPATAWLAREIGVERERGAQKFGRQLDVPLRDPVLHKRDGFTDPQRMAEHYEIPTEVRAKALIGIHVERGDYTWPHIVVEELAEAVGARSFEQMRAEVVQLAATCLGWLEAIDHQLSAQTTDATEGSR